MGMLVEGGTFKAEKLQLCDKKKGAAKIGRWFESGLLSSDDRDTCHVPCAPHRSYSVIKRILCYILCEFCVTHAAVRNKML